MVEHGPFVACTDLGTRENDCMKGYIVLAHELIELDILRISPPELPILCIIGSNRGVTNAGIEPHVEDLLFIA